MHSSLFASMMLPLTISRNYATISYVVLTTSGEASKSELAQTGGMTSFKSSLPQMVQLVSISNIQA